MGIIIDYYDSMEPRDPFARGWIFFRETPDRLSNGGGSESKSKIQVPTKREMSVTPDGSGKNQGL